MTPIESVFLLVGALITLVGLARGYAKELGSTLIILVAIFILSLVEDYTGQILEQINQQGWGSGSGNSTDLMLCLALQSLFVIMVFAGYAGRILDFQGSPASAPQGPLLSIAIGLLNGYLVAGTLWYYLNKYNYPYMSSPYDLTDRAKTLIEFLPQTLLTSPVYWMIPVAILLLLRVRG